MATHDVSVFHLVHAIYATVNEAIDTSLGWDELNAPTVNYALVRPLVERFTPRFAHPAAGDHKTGTPARALKVPSSSERGETGAHTQTDPEHGLGAVLYALMANRIQYVSLAEADLSYAPLQTTRAALCELLAMKILRTFPNTADEVELVGELVKSFCPYDGAPDEILRATFGDDRKEIETSRASALELAIISSSKHFLSLPLIQHLISQIYNGQLIYTPTASRGLITDTYVSERNRLRRRASHSSLRPTPPARGAEAVIPKAATQDELAEVYVYNPYEAGWLDHQRLKVPKWRKWLEFGGFATLIALFVATLSARDFARVGPMEVIFVLYTFGFILDEFAASKEHGWSVYVANILIFLFYLVLRIFALASHSPDLSELAFDILACGACVLFPRLVFFLIKDNVVVLALKEMIKTFVGFMCLTTVAFSGICFCLWTLGRATWTVKQIVWLMLQIWFGSSYLGFQASASFHPLFGPLVLISYAALCNTLLITILISILSNKFAAINQNAQQERVVGTVEGVKSDAIFSYLPPVNLVALAFLGPLSWVMSPRTLHRVNVFFIRVTNLPILFAISAYERYKYRQNRHAVRLGQHSDHVQRSSMFDSFLGGGSEVLIRSVFDTPPVPVQSGDTTPPRTAAGASSASVDAAAAPPSPGRAPPIDSATDSPLARIFRRRARVPSGLGSISAAIANADEAAVPMLGSPADDGEVRALKKEIKEMRESQLRVEELLNKVLAGGK